MSQSPLPPVETGRSPNGRFAVGNREARGNPHAKAIGMLRKAVYAAITPSDIEEIVTKLLDLGKSGNLFAIRLIFDYCVGTQMQLGEGCIDPDSSTKDDKIRLLDHLPTEFLLALASGEQPPKLLIECSPK
jgi:hypothetical protein